MRLLLSHEQNRGELQWETVGAAVQNLQNGKTTELSTCWSSITKSARKNKTIKRLGRWGRDTHNLSYHSHNTFDFVSPYNAGTEHVGVGGFDIYERETLIKRYSPKMRSQSWSGRWKGWAPGIPPSLTSPPGPPQNPERRIEVGRGKEKNS